MGTSSHSMRWSIATVLFFILFANLQQAAAISVGDIAPNFTLREHGTNNWVSLRDYEGEVIVLDFFAEWCGPCRTAAAELEPYVQQYFDNRGGNNHGVPVRLISISLDNDPPEYVDAYIAYYGLDLVLDDLTHSVYWTYGTGPIPQFAIVNGADSINYDQWEVIYLRTGYGSGAYTTFRSYINSVIPVPPEEIPGDANFDGYVNDLDAAILASNWQIETDAGYEDGDFNGDGKVNDVDATIMAANWDTTGSSSASIPEPSALCLISFLATWSIAAGFRQRRHRNG